MCFTGSLNILLLQIRAIVAIFMRYHFKLTGKVVMQFVALFFFLAMVLEFSTLFWMFQWLGLGKGLMCIILGMVIGGIVMRHHLGMAKMMMAGQFFRMGGMSFYDMLLPVRIPLAGLLLALPTGFLSSLLGLILLIPFGGRSAASSSQNKTSHHYTQNGFQYRSRQTKHQDDDNIIEGEYTVKSSHQQSEQSHSD